MGDCGLIVVKRSRYERRKAAAEARKMERRFRKALAVMGNGKAAVDLSKYKPLTTVVHSDC